MGNNTDFARNGRGNEMNVQGSNCSILIKTEHKEMDVPYSAETMREAVSFLKEEASIEGDGVCRGIQINSGITGCIVTPLTIGTAPLLLYLAMGGIGNPVYISATNNLYQYQLSLLPMEDTELFDLVQDRGGERKLFEGCRVQGFELRVMRGEAIKLKLDITGESTPRAYPYTDTFERKQGERYSGDTVTYKINEIEYKNIYGITLITKKQGGTRTEIWIKRTIEKGRELPGAIEEMTITAQLLRDKYDLRYYGTFRITLKRLVMVSDETDVNSTDDVIGPVRYYVAGTVKTEIFNSTGEQLP